MFKEKLINPKNPDNITKINKFIRKKHGYKYRRTCGDDKTYLGFYIPAELGNRWRDYCVDRDISQTQFFIMKIKEEMDKQNES